MGNLVSLDSSSDDYKWVVEKMSSTIATHNNIKITGYQYVNIYKVIYPSRELVYLLHKVLIASSLDGNVNEILEEHLFHGSVEARKIAKEGFKIEMAKPNGMFGKGIYFADLSSKSNQYTFGSEQGSKLCPAHGDEYCSQCLRSMLICKVTLGRFHNARSPMHGITSPPSGFHSVVGDPAHCANLKYKEYIIYDEDQAIPEYLIEYKITGTSRNSPEVCVIC